MKTETYDAIMAHRDQMISVHTDTSALHIAIFASHVDTIKDIVTIARAAGLRVKKNVIDKGAPDAETHLSIH